MKSYSSFSGMPSATNDVFTHALQTRQTFPAAYKDNPHKGPHFGAYMLTVFAFVLFAAPTIMCIVLATDNDVRYWIGRWGYLAIFVPIFLCGQHLFHILMIRDNKLPREIFLVTMLLPAGFFMLIGASYWSNARYLVGHLKSNDCSPNSGLAEKFNLQEAYDEAHHAWDECVASRRKENMGGPLRSIPSLQSCDNWPDLVDDASNLPWKGYPIPSHSIRVRNPSNAPKWQYLADVETDHVCGGFCRQGPSLWTPYQKLGRHGGACSQFVAFHFLTVIHRGFMVFMLGALVFFLAIPTYFLAKNHLAYLGYTSSSSLA